MAKPFTPAEIEALPPLLSINQASRLLLWDHGTLSKAVESGTSPVLAIDKGTRKVLPKQALMELLAGRRAGAA